MAGGVMLLVRQHSAQVKLRLENLSLEKGMDRLNLLAAENESISNRLAREKNSHASAIDSLAELGRLQTEVSSQKEEIKKLRAELGAELTVPAFQTLPGSIRAVNIPKESWTFAGYASPEAAFQSMLWATLHGDVNAIRASITPAEQKRRQEQEWKNKSDDEIADTGIRGLGKATGVQILNIQMFSADEAHFTVYINGFDQSDQPLWLDLKRVAGEWKSDASEHHREGH
jgi:hypothetical protein